MFERARALWRSLTSVSSGAPSPPRLLTVDPVECKSKEKLQTSDKLISRFVLVVLLADDSLELLANFGVACDCRLKSRIFCIHPSCGLIDRHRRMTCVLWTTSRTLITRNTLFRTRCAKHTSGAEYTHTCARALRIPINV